MIEADVKPDLLPYWCGHDGLAVSREQFIWDLPNAKRLHRMKLRSVPSKYEWREHLFSRITPYCLLSRELAVHIGDSITVHELPRGTVKEKFELRIAARKPYGYRTSARATVGQKKGLLIVWDDGHNIQVISVPTHSNQLLTFELFVIGVYLNPDESAIFVSLADNTLSFQATKHEVRVFATDTLRELAGPVSLPAATDFLISDDGNSAFVNRRELRTVDSGSVIARFDRFDSVWTNPSGGDPFLGFRASTGSLVSYSVAGVERQLFMSKTGPTSVKVSADGRTWAVVFGSHGGTSVLIVKDSIKERYIIDDHFGDGVSAGLSSDGRHLVVAINHSSSIGLNSGYALSVMDTHRGVIVKSQDQIVDYINFVRLVPNRDCIVVGFNNGIVQRRALGTLNVEWQRKFHEGYIRKLAVNSDATIMASLGGDNRLMVCELTSGSVLTSKPFGFLPVDMQVRGPNELIVIAPGGDPLVYTLRR